MTPERWGQLEELYQAARALPPSERSALLERADAELRASEQKYRNIFQTVGVSIWEEDFSAVKAAIDALRAQGVSDFRTLASRIQSRL